MNFDNMNNKDYTNFHYYSGYFLDFPVKKTVLLVKYFNVKNGLIINWIFEHHHIRAI